MKFLGLVICSLVSALLPTLGQSGIASDSKELQADGKPPMQVAVAFRRSYPLELVVEMAVRIARIRLIGPTDRHLSDGTPCPNTYRATVVESYKGGTEPFDVFVPTPSDFRGFDVEYLALLNRWEINSADVRALMDELFSPREREELATCRMEDLLYVAGSYKTIWAVDSELSLKMGRPWLEADTRPAVSWCNFEGDPPGELFVPDGVRVGNRWYEAISLGGAERLIRRAVKNSPIRDDGSLDESFVAANCD